MKNTQTNFNMFNHWTCWITPTC